MASNDNDVTYMTSLGLQSNLTTAASDSIFYYHRGIIGDDMNRNTPTLVLIHGYPQSSFMWRHIVPLLPSNIPLFIPDIPGYGRSSPLAGPHDKRSVGQAILAALRSLLPRNNGEQQPIVIAGHDRGARICHRIAVDEDVAVVGPSQLSIRGTILLDIVPTIIQWQSFANPLNAASAFHWPFLANVSLATAMIQAQGGDVWTRNCLERWAGSKKPNAVGYARFQENDALRVYSSLFKQESVIRSSCDDYRAGAHEDIQLQEEDQKQGRKLNVHTIVIYSADYIGKRYDMEKVWSEWMGRGGILETEAIGDGVGHFIAEEAPEKTSSAMLAFYEKVALSSSK